MFLFQAYAPELFILDAHAESMRDSPSTIFHPSISSNSGPPRAGSKSSSGYDNADPSSPYKYPLSHPDSHRQQPSSSYPDSSRRHPSSHPDNHRQHPSFHSDTNQRHPSSYPDIHRQPGRLSYDNLRSDSNIVLAIIGYHGSLTKQSQKTKISKAVLCQ